MKLENQVTSLELSKKLKELGVKQESLYVWVEKLPPIINESRIITIEMYKEGLNNSIFSDETKKAIIKNSSASAFTVAELGEMLPKGFKSGRVLNDDTMKFCDSAESHVVVYDTNEANARAEILIYLLENKLITL